MSVLDRPATDGARAPRRFIGEEERRQYQADGFLVLRGLLSEDERQAIVEWLRGVAARRDELPSWHIIPEPGAPADPQDPLTAVRKFQALRTTRRPCATSGAARRPPKRRANCWAGLMTCA
jgi:hypothetical protein